MDTIISLDRECKTILMCQELANLFLLLFLEYELPFSLHVSAFKHKHLIEMTIYYYTEDEKLLEWALEKSNGLLEKDKKDVPMVQVL